VRAAIYIYDAFLSKKRFLADFSHFVERETEKGREIRTETKKETIKKEIRWRNGRKERDGRKKG
jgi:hypothetical protein